MCVYILYILYNIYTYTIHIKYFYDGNNAYCKKNPNIKLKENKSFPNQGWLIHTVKVSYVCFAYIIFYNKT